MFKVGPNPYGMCCTLGIQGDHPAPRDVNWLIDYAIGMRAKCIEFHFGQLMALNLDQLKRIRETLEEHGIEPILSGPWPLEELPNGFPIAKALGGKTIRTHLSPILCGARSELGSYWDSLVSNIQIQLNDLAPRAENGGFVIAIENHQDFGSNELVEFCDVAGPAIGICLDTGNPLAVGEDPMDFTRRVSPKVRHVHLKDYRAQATSEGYRLVRCAIGDGAVPLQEIHQILAQNHSELTASIEPGALNARHIRLRTVEWQERYRPDSLNIEVACRVALGRAAIEAHEEFRTPWELNSDTNEVCEFELGQMSKSVFNMQELGWLPK